MSATLEAALAYAARGWEVLPACIVNGTKKSHKSVKRSGSKWGKTRDPAEIRRDFLKWPKALVGIATGSDSGIWVLDVDTKEGHGVDGLHSLDRLLARYGPLPATLMAVSPSGSVHYYFSWPLEFPVVNTTGKLAPGLDTRGKNGMVLAPPSRREDGTYRWLNDLPIVHAPMWLVGLAQAPKRVLNISPVLDGTQLVPDELDDEADPEMQAYELRERLDDATAMVEELEEMEPTLPGERIPYELYFRLVAAVRNDVGIAGFPLIVRMSQARSLYGSRAGQSAENIAKSAWDHAETLKDIHLGSVYYHTRKLEDDDDED